MAMVKRLQEYLDSQAVPYEVKPHREAYTSQEIAATSHVSGKAMAKVVMVKRGGAFVMAVLPAACKVGMDRLEQVFGIPGVGMVSYKAILNFDYSLIMGISMFSIVGVSVSALIVTHRHVDHVYGFPSLAHNLGLAGRAKPLHVYALPETLAVLHGLNGVFAIHSDHVHQTYVTDQAIAESRWSPASTCRSKVTFSGRLKSLPLMLHSA